MSSSVSWILPNDAYGWEIENHTFGRRHPDEKTLVSEDQQRGPPSTVRTPNAPSVNPGCCGRTYILCETREGLRRPQRRNDARRVDLIVFLCQTQ